MQNNYNLHKVSNTIRNLISKHLYATRVKELIQIMGLKFTFIGIGQGGNRIASEASTFGFPTYIINTSQNDMLEHKNRIPEEKMILTLTESTKQGTAKNAFLGEKIVRETLETIYGPVLLSDDVMNADFIFICASLGGGTGSGAIPVIAEVTQTIKNQEKRMNNSVGLIISLPSKKESGIEYRNNTLKALQEINQLIQDKKIGCVIVIDNNYFEESDHVSKYTNLYKQTTDSRTLSNAYVATSIIELLSFLTLGGSSTIDQNELLKLLGYPGYLNIKRQVNDEVIMGELDYTNMTYDETKEVASKYGLSLLENNDLLCKYNRNYNINSSLVQLIAPTTVSLDNLTSMINSIEEQFKTVVHRGIAQQQAQTGITSYVIYNSAIAPPCFSELVMELEEAKKIEETRVKAAAADNNIFSNVKLVMEEEFMLKDTKISSANSIFSTFSTNNTQPKEEQPTDLKQRVANVFAQHSTKNKSL